MYDTISEVHVNKPSRILGCSIYDKKCKKLFTSLTFKFSNSGHEFENIDHQETGVYFIWGFDSIRYKTILQTSCYFTSKSKGSNNK